MLIVVRKEKMNRNTERNIRNLQKQIFEKAIRTFAGARLTLPRYNGQHEEITLAPKVFMSFQNWADDLRKPFFLVLWRGPKYLMEFDLSCVIFSDNGTLTWILNKPTREENRQNLAELGYQEQEINPQTVEMIHNQMISCNSRAKRTPIGYILAEEEDVDEAIERFLEVVANSVKSYQQLDATNGENTADEDIRVIEGQIAESKILGRRRNRVIVERRKRQDQFTCQACQFCVPVNGRYIIECHHRFPLRGEQITGIEDLICLCPTCHRIAHRRDRPYSVEEIQRILQQRRIQGP
jgi:predicted HNH restriction endonuclease